MHLVWLKPFPSLPIFPFRWFAKTGICRLTLQTVELLLRGIQPQSEIRPPNYQTFYCWSNTNARSKTATFVLYATQHPNPSQPAKYHNHIPLIPLINITSFQNTPNKNKKSLDHTSAIISHHQPSPSTFKRLFSSRQLRSCPRGLRGLQLPSCAAQVAALPQLSPGIAQGALALQQRHRAHLLIVCVLENPPGTRGFGSSHWGLPMDPEMAGSLVDKNTNVRLRAESRATSADFPNCILVLWETDQWRKDELYTCPKILGLKTCPSIRIWSFFIIGYRLSVRYIHRFILYRKGLSLGHGWHPALVSLLLGTWLNNQKIQSHWFWMIGASYYLWVFCCVSDRPHHIPSHSHFSFCPRLEYTVDPQIKRFLIIIMFPIINIISIIIISSSSIYIYTFCHEIVEIKTTGIKYIPHGIKCSIEYGLSILHALHAPELCHPY